MSFAEMKDMLAPLSPTESAELQEHLDAIEEGVSVEEWRALNAALDEELKDPSPRFNLEEVRDSNQRSSSAMSLELEQNKRRRLHDSLSNDG
jgi:hypothetical protein